MRGMTIAVAAFAISGALALALAKADAAPLVLDLGLAAAGPLPQDGAALIPASGGCGPYAHRNPWGYCVAGGQWGGYPVRPYVERACPPGYYLGPYGHYCWPAN